MSTRVGAAASAVVIAGLFLGAGSGFAAAGGLKAGRDVADATITTQDVRDRALTGADVAPSSIGSADLANGVGGATGPDGPVGGVGPGGPVGPAGPSGASGPMGPVGRTGLSTVQYVVSAAHTFPGLTYGSVGARCPAGTKVLSGGIGAVDPGRTTTIRENAPLNDGAGWTTTLLNGEDFSITVYGWAVCAKA